MKLNEIKEEDINNFIIYNQNNNINDLDDDSEDNDDNNNDEYILSEYNKTASLLLDLEAKWNQIELSTSKRSTLKKERLKANENFASTLSYEPNENQFRLSSLIHQFDNSFEIYAMNKVKELESLKTNSCNQNNNDNTQTGNKIILAYSDIGNNKNNKQTKRFDPYDIINDNSTIEKKLKSVFEMITITDNRNRRNDNTNNNNTGINSLINTQPKKTFLKESSDKNKDKDKDKDDKKMSKSATMFLQANNNKGNTNPLNHKTKKSLGEENEIKNKIKQNSLLLKQLFPIK